jgi:hypothetical protein
MLEIRDINGALQNLQWLVENYGALVVHPATDGPGWRVVKIQENDAATVIVVKMLAADGTPMPDVRVAWYWPDAPEDRHAGPANGLPAGMRPGRAFASDTNANGDVGFDMGDGARYWPDQDQIGPHAVWVYGPQTNSDVVLGLGMVGGTNNSLWPTYQWCEDVPPPEPPPPPPGDIAAQCDIIEAAVAEIRRMAVPDYGRP